MKTTPTKFLTLFFTLGVLSALQGFAGTVTATLDPQEITVGDSAQLTVTVTGTQEQPSMPEVAGLDITAVGQSTQIEIVNGSMTANASNTYQVTPQHEGTFTIPAIRAGSASSQPLTLRVLKDASSQTVNPPPASSLSGPVVSPPPTNALAPADQDTAPIERFGSIKITLPKREFFVGQLIPVDIKVYLPNDIHTEVNDLPQLTNDGFTLNSLSPKPRQTVEVVEGRAYTVLNWHSALTGVKAGEYPLNLQMSTTVVVPQRMPRMDPDDLFNNVFRNAMAAMGQKKNVTLQSTPETLKVLPLPQVNRPADFGGAVGQFEVEASATPTGVNVGDPITLRLKISGTGNFDRVSTDMLASDSHWKTYSPKSHFDAADSVGYQGTKTFEQPIIPNEAGSTNIPSVTFSYFDPETRQYVIRSTAPIAVTVGGNSAPPLANGPVVTPTHPPVPVPPVAPAPGVAQASNLRPNKIDAGSFVSTLQPLYLNPIFMAGQGIPLLALLGGLAFLRRRQLATQPDRLRATAVQQAIRQQIEAMDQAMKDQRTDAFFVHARSALQYCFGHQWGLRPETITLADLDGHLENKGKGENIRSVFEMADQASYSNLHFGEADLRHWREIILKELKENT